MATKVVLVTFHQGQLYWVTPKQEEIYLLYNNRVIWFFTEPDVVCYLGTRKEMFDDKGRSVEYTMVKVIYRDMIGELQLPNESYLSEVET